MVTCPFCGSDGECRHLIGWTEDGRTVELRLGIVAGKKVDLLPTDRVIKTGVSARVYRAGDGALHAAIQQPVAPGRSRGAGVVESPVREDRMMRITHAIRIKYDHDRDLREPVGKCSQAVVAGLNRRLASGKARLEGELTGWGDMTHTLCDGPADSISARYHVRMIDD